MKKTKHAFTLAEALILLLIASLLAAALVPVITRKHKEVGEHGEWVCTMDSDGKHVVKSTYRGKITQFETAYNNGEMCVFSPPAAAKDFTVKAVGGGGSGAGGTAGAAETIFNSMTENSNFAGVVDTNTNFSVIVGGAGGGGGGMACGEAEEESDTINKDWNDPQIFLTESEPFHGAYLTDDEYWQYFDSDDKGNPPRYRDLTEVPKANDCDRISLAGDVKCGTNGEGIKAPDPDPYTGEYRYHKYGMIDKPHPDFPDYNLLKQNDKQYTDNYEYGKAENNIEVTIFDAHFNAIEDVPVYDVKYYYIEPGISAKQDYQDRAICFAEKDWPMSKEMNNGQYKGLFITNKDPNKDPKDDTIKCWNLPGQGGKAGGPQNASTLENIRAGQSIFVSPGEPGSGQLADDGGTHTVGAFLLTSSGQLTLQTKPSYDGGIGTDGTNTVVTIGDQQITAAGGKGGAARQLMKINYINVPVQECSIVQTHIRPQNNSACPDGLVTTNPSDCTDHPACPASDYCVTWGTCTGTRYTTDADGNPTTEEYTYTCCKDEVPHYQCVADRHDTILYKETGECFDAIRSIYFDDTLKVQACIYSSAVLPEDVPESPTPLNVGGEAGFMGDADYPHFSGQVEEYKADNSGDGEDILYYTLDKADRKKYVSAFGGGGYGAGELTKNYVKDDNGNSYAKFVGDPGDIGYVAIMKSNAYGGTGGQAGQYVSTMVKKLGKLEITIGKPGAPTNGDEDGISGGDTVIKEYGKEEPLFYLKGGYGGQAKKLAVMAGPDTVKGGDGGPSPIENESNRAKIIPYGGLSGSNSSYDGQTAIISDIWGGASISGASFGLPAGISYVLNKVGGHPLDMTYGAGGGGGAGGVSDAGGGGAGTPGAVIIKW